MFPHEERRSRLIRAFPDTIDAFLVTSVVNVRYLSGFTGSNGALLVPREAAAVIATDGRYLTQVAAEASELECQEARAAGVALVERARRDGIRRLGIEAAKVTLTEYDGLRAAAAGEVELVAVRPLVEPLRVVKDAAELDALRTACAITDAAFADVLDRLRVGLTERDVAWELESAMRRHGAAGPAFEAIVAFGLNSAVPHHRPTDREAVAGDLVKVDFGALYDGYHADMTRTVVLGRAAEWQRDLHQLVAGIQSRCVDECRVGAVPVELNARAHRAIEDSGNRVDHGLGHGVGLEIHEDPFLTQASSAGPLAADVAVTIEPGIYLVGKGGVRIEDTVLVTNPAADPLTASPRELLEV